MTDLIDIIPLSRLAESPTNPRKQFDAAALQELANSISSQGLLQPIVVRPVLEINSEDYQIVFGHRRFRAAQLAGLGEIPCIVRAMSDVEVAQAQIHENLERADVSPLEEADGYATLMRLHGISVDQLVADTGKSRTYIYNRLKLASLTERSRAAVVEHQIPAEIATLIARVPAPLQGQAIERVTYKEYGTDTVMVQSFREAKSALRREFTVRIITAEDGRAVTAWDPTDATLTTCGACTSCPKLSTNDPGLLDALGAGLCIDTACHAAKDDAAEHRWLDSLRLAGRLIEGEDADEIASHRPAVAPRGYVMLTEQCYPAPGGREVIGLGQIPATYAMALDALHGDGQDVPDITVIEHHKTWAKCITASESASWVVPSYRRLIGVPVTPLMPTAPSVQTPASSAGSSSAGASAHRGGGEGGEMDAGASGDDGDFVEPWHPADHRTPAERAVMSHNPQTGWPAIKRAVMRSAINAPRDLEDLRLIACCMLETNDANGLEAAGLMGWEEAEQHVERFDATMRRLQTTRSADELASFITLTAIAALPLRNGCYYIDNDVRARLNGAARYGVDVLAPAGPGQQQMDEAGPAGHAQGIDHERDPNTVDMFQAA